MDMEPILWGVSFFTGNGSRSFVVLSLAFSQTSESY